MNKPPPILRNGCPLDRDLTPKLVPIDSLKPLGQETRKHPKTQIRKLARNLETYGFVLPIVIDGQGRIVHGAALVEAARLLELIEVPAVVIDNLDEARLRALRLNLNRLAEESSWDDNALRQEFDEIQFIDSTLDLSLTGFETAEIDLVLTEPDGDEDDMVPDPEAIASPVTVFGDLWVLGEHCIFCGDAKDPQSYAVLFDGTEGRARTVITDPPYNVKIDGHVCGSGKIKHGEFVEAVGEMSQKEFRSFLSTAMRNVADYSIDGSLHYWLMDWRHIHDLYAAGEEVYGPPRNLAVWVKTNAGMGSLYRSQHELVGVFKSGKAPHMNNVQLGRHGRYRSNVWQYPGQNAFGGGQNGKLALHPTVKPVALVADAIRDSSNRGDIVLDPFGGSGTTLIAAERTERRARLIEFEPRYVDVAIERWQRLTGQTAIHAVTGKPYARTADA